MTDYSNFSDRKLINACREGNAPAWDALVSRYERLVYTIPIRYGLPPSEADDVFQSVWLALLRNLHRLTRPDRLGAWLVTTARRECWERRRGSDFKWSTSVSLEALPATDDEGEPTIEEMLSDHEEFRRVRQALDRLEPDCQRLLWYLYYDRNTSSYADIATEMDMAIGSIGPTRARCLQKLRQLLDR